MIQIRNKPITRDGPPYILAEIGVNHDGDVNLARQLIDHAHVATADAVKFQLFDADLLLAKSAGLVDYQKSSAESADDLLKPLQLTPDQLAPLIAHAHVLGIAAIVTPFSVELVPACVDIKVDAIKIASPDLVNKPLIEAAIETQLPLIISTGAADLEEIRRTVSWLDDALERTILLHCVSSYPTEPERATLGAISALRQHFPTLPIGYSDHTVETFTAALAVAAGACILEKHLTPDRTRKGPDHAASLEPAQLAEYCALARIGYIMRGPYAKQPQPPELQIREQTRQSIAAKKDIPANTTLTQEMLTIKRPGTGIPAANLVQTIGKKTKNLIPANTLLTPTDIE
jgi:N-acetylneuraminate synthase/N,N'-diacetyllegionaminate synthase